MTRTQKRLVGFIAVTAVVNAAYRLIYATGFQRTAALYVGVPALLAIGLVMLPRTGSATAAMLKWSTLSLLLATVILPEGLICLLFVLPLVAMVCLVVGGLIDLGMHLGRSQGRTMSVLWLPLLLMSLEGVVGSPFGTADAAEASVEVRATPAEVEEALTATPRFDVSRPLFFRLGFNKPIGATGSGLEVGDERVIEFTGGTHDDHPGRLFGLTGERSVDHHATMHLRITESEPGRVVFTVVHDGTMGARWAKLRRTIVTWQRVDAEHTRVTWRLEYERLLYPTFYFAPLQRYAAHEAAEYLLAAVVEDPLR